MADGAIDRGGDVQEIVRARLFEEALDVVPSAEIESGAAGNGDVATAALLQFFHHVAAEKSGAAGDDDAFPAEGLAAHGRGGEFDGSHSPLLMVMRRST